MEYLRTNNQQMIQDPECECPGKEARGTGKYGKTVWILSGIVVFFLAAVGAVYALLVLKKTGGYQDYTVRMRQYVTEYSEQFAYSEVVTVEYPEIEGIDEEQREMINRMMYDTAMDRTNYWHLKPGDYVKSLQKEYSIFSSDASCEVSYHSQYLLSLIYDEIYAPVHPVYYVNRTKRGLNVDLLTGEEYALTDIIRVEDEFIDLWARKANKQYDGFFGEEKEDRELLLAWFLKEDEEWNEAYEFVPYFYVEENQDFVIGIAVDPKFVSRARAPKENAYEVCFAAQELEEFRTESNFWKKYDKSKSVGAIIECEDLQTNRWLDDISGAQDYWDRIGAMY